MKKLIMFVFICSIENQIASIRPNASYVIHSGDYAGIEWTDKVQTKPTPQEMATALASCQAQAAASVGPSLDDRVAALEEATQKIADKTGTIITLETSGVTP